MDEHPYEVISRARAALKALEARLVEQSFDATSSTQAVSFGRAAEAADVAENALFNVLNVLSSHLDDADAAAAIQGALHA